jgi:hypothetical protein
MWSFTPGAQGAEAMLTGTEWKTDRRRQYLGTVPEDEQRALSKFMGMGTAEALEKLLTLIPGIRVSFKKSSLACYLKYASVLAGTEEDQPNNVWTYRKQLLEKAVFYDIGLSD